MKPTMKQFSLCILVLILLTSCTHEIVKTVEVTRLVPQTFEVTSIATKLIYVTRVHTEVVTPTPSDPHTPALMECLPDDCVRYFAGAGVIWDYYLYIDQGLYKNAYNLLGTEEQERRDYGAFAEGVEIFYNAVKVIAVEPHSTKDPDSAIQYRVKYYVLGDEWFNRYVRYVYVTAVVENGEWKVGVFGPTK